MDNLNVADVEDAWLDSDLFEEWKQEFEEQFFEPYREMGEANMALAIPDEVLDMLERIDPETHAKFMKFREQEERLREQKEGGSDNAYAT